MSEAHINIIWYNDNDVELGRTYLKDTNKFTIPTNHPTKGQFFLTVSDQIHIEIHQKEVTEDESA